MGDVVLFDPPAGLNDKIASMLAEQKQVGQGVDGVVDGDKEQEVMLMNKPQQGGKFLK